MSVQSVGFDPSYDRYSQYRYGYGNYADPKTGKCLANPEGYDENGRSIRTGSYLASNGGANDGKIGAGNTLWSFFKGATINIVTGLLSNPMEAIMGLAVFGGAMLAANFLLPGIGGALVLAAYSGYGLFQAASMAKQSYDQISSSTDDQATQAGWENAGTAFTIALLSAWGLKGGCSAVSQGMKQNALKAAAKEAAKNGSVALRNGMIKNLEGATIESATISNAGARLLTEMTAGLDDAAIAKLATASEQELLAAAKAAAKRIKAAGGEVPGEIAKLIDEASTANMKAVLGAADDKLATFQKFIKKAGEAKNAALQEGTEAAGQAAKNAAIDGAQNVAWTKPGGGAGETFTPDSTSPFIKTAKKIAANADDNAVKQAATETGWKNAANMVADDIAKVRALAQIGDDAAAAVMKQSAVNEAMACIDDAITQSIASKGLLPEAQGAYRSAIEKAVAETVDEAIAAATKAGKTLTSAEINELTQSAISKGLRELPLKAFDGGRLGMTSGEILPEHCWFHNSRNSVRGAQAWSLTNYFMDTVDTVSIIPRTLTWGTTKVIQGTGYAANSLAAAPARTGITRVFTPEGFTLKNISATISESLGKWTETPVVGEMLKTAPTVEQTMGTTVAVGGRSAAAPSVGQNNVRYNQKMEAKLRMQNSPRGRFGDYSCYGRSRFPSYAT